MQVCLLVTIVAEFAQIMQNYALYANYAQLGQIMHKSPRDSIEQHLLQQAND